MQDCRCHSPCVPLVNSNDSIVPSKVFLLPCFNSVNTCYHYEMKVIRDTDHRRLGYTNTAATAVFSGIAIPLQRNKKTRKCLFWFGLFCGFTVRFPSLPVSSFHKLFTHELRTLSLQCNTVLLHVKHLFC